MKNLLITSLFALPAAAAPQETVPAVAAPAAHVPPRVVEMAICLDTSGSMSGLINAARQKLWAIVNDLALAQPAPRLRVALLTFGTPDYGSENGFVKLRSGLTEDLDKVSDELFALTTNGGDEYVGRVLQHALGQLEWSTDAALKLIVVAGNEAADQDPQVDFREVCRAAIAGDVIVNSIYCGNPADSLAPVWQEVARLADGRFAAIDQDNGTVVIATPFDQQLADLSGAINATYLPFGTAGAAAAENQARQDANAAGLNSAAAAARAQTKASGLYFCSWDLVDACERGDVKLEALADEELPDELRGLAPEQRQQIVDERRTERARLQNQVNEISKQRDAFVAEEMKKNAASDDRSFDQAIKGAIREQARAKGFDFVKPQGGGQ